MRPNSALGVKWLLSISLLVSMLTNCWEKGAYSRRTGEGGCDKGETGEHPLFLQFRSTALWPDTSIHKPARGKGLALRL